MADQMLEIPTGRSVFIPAGLDEYHLHGRGDYFADSTARRMKLSSLPPHCERALILTPLSATHLYVAENPIVGDSQGIDTPLDAASFQNLTGWIG